MTQEEANRLQEGCVIREKRSGRLRVVRKVSKLESANFKRTLKVGDTFAVQLVILRCSWTGRCLTTLGITDLKSRFDLTSYRVKLNSDIDAIIKYETKRTPGQPQKLSCCSVRGLA